MGVFTLSRAESAEPGIYPFDPHKHLRQVAELVSAVFAQELDAEGRNALYEMQMVGRFGPLLGGLFGASLFTDFVAGYVWVERGEVLGNATLQRIDYGGMRWRISNVAVTPEHRGRGIARSLMLSCLSEIAQQGGAWAVLQVRIDNPPARKLYESLGFTDVYQEGIWRLAGLSRRPSTPDTRWPLELLPATAWRERFELAQAAQTSLADWIGPIQKAEYEVGLLQAWGKLWGTGRASIRCNDGGSGATAYSRAPLKRKAASPTMYVECALQSDPERAAISRPPLCNVDCKRWPRRHRRRSLWRIALIIPKGWPRWKQPVSAHSGCC